MAEIAHREKNLPLALKKVDEGSESVLGAARTLQLNRQTLKIKMKQAGVKSQFKSGGQLKTGKPDSLDDAFELASTRVVGVADVARSKGVKRTTLAMRMSRAGIRSSVSVGRQPSYTYSQEDMDEAIRMCEAGEMAPKEAASHFSIPSGTLGSRMFRRKQQQRK
ncbi:uncharacterized protein LOC118434758 [Folsomia candida]|uniref:uncharacterized protein LOC118434758 n=1 Tax=Folsomia candida TaxID=158441 RepID=UPI001604D741|nr:uncharacterized protein LOC118434758 [Folsomia candida]